MEIKPIREYTACFSAGLTTGTYAGYKTISGAVNAAKAMCEGNIFPGQKGSWMVKDFDNKIVRSGIIKYKAGK